MEWFYTLGNGKDNKQKSNNCLNMLEISDILFFQQSFLMSKGYRSFKFMLENSKIRKSTNSVKYTNLNFHATQKIVYNSASYHKFCSIFQMINN